MKTLKCFAFFGLASVLFLTSCSTMEKRLYTSGYHVEWKTNKQNSANHELTSQVVEKQFMQSDLNAVEQQVVGTATIENIEILSDNNITASVDNSFITSVEKPASIQKTGNNNFSDRDKISNTIIFDRKDVKSELTFSEKKKSRKSYLSSMSSAKKAGVGLYILAFFIPVLAVGIHTGWKRPTLYCFLWSLLGWLPGIIHAFIQLGK